MQTEGAFQICIDTAKGEASLESLQHLQVFGHEYLQHIVSPIAAPDITLSTLRDHIKTPYNLPNTSISPSFIAHQFKDLSKCLIIDCSKCQTVDPLLTKATILKGYSISIKPNLPANQAKALYDEQSLYKMLELDFGMSAIKPAFIGEINLRTLDLESEHVRTLMRVYSGWSRKIGCPVWMNCVDSERAACVFDGEAKAKVEGMYGRIEEVLGMMEEGVRGRVVVYNPPVLVEEQIQSVSKLSVENKSFKRISEIREKYQITFGYDLLRYNSNPFLLRMLSLQAQQYPSKTVFSAGVLYKTDTSSFCGQGYYLKDSLPILSLPQPTLTLTFKTNYLNLLNWRKKKIQIIQVKYWKCVQCGKQQPETVMNFKKFDKIFCSVGCIRNHKF